MRNTNLLTKYHCSQHNPKACSLCHNYKCPGNLNPDLKENKTDQEKED